MKVFKNCYKYLHREDVPSMIFGSLGGVGLGFILSYFINDNPYDEFLGTLFLIGIFMLFISIMYFIRLILIWWLCK